MSTNSDSTHPPWDEAREEDGWSEDQREAWQVIHQSRPGDEVLFADRSMPMEVVETGEEDGENYIDVAKPRADGTYRVRENLSNATPKVSSDVGRANDLHWVERQPEPRGLSESEYRDLVESRSQYAQDSFVRYDYNSWEDTVRDVVEDWAEEVAFENWRGYKHHPDWEDGDSEAIFESVLDHSDYDRFGEADSTRSQAEAALYKDVYHHGREDAEANLITSESDYRDLVDTLAHHSLDRYDRKNYANARVAVRDTISQWVDDRHGPALGAVVEYGTRRFPEDDYDDVHPDDREREMAFDILDHDVWETVQEFQRDRGDHDPTLRGLTYTDYKDLVEGLGMQTARYYDGQGFLRVTAKDVVNAWADAVENQDWEDHRHRVWAAGDVEDIFSSAVIHADANPFVWNPFSSNKERKMAVQAILPDVIGHAENIIEEDETPGEMKPVDDYIQNTLGLDDVSYADFSEAHPEDAQQTVENIMEAMDGNEVGWTFADEIIEHGGTVPEETNEWVLVDYGVIREGDTLRKLAWFNRETADVLVLSGKANGEPEVLAEMDDPYQQFHVTLHEDGADDPSYQVSSADLEDALDYVHERLGTNSADFRVLEAGDQTYVQDQITDEDINAGGAIDALVPNVPFGIGDVMTLADRTSRGAVREINFWGPQLAKITAYAVLSAAPKWVSDRFDGIRVDPSMHKDHGVGVDISKEFGQGRDVGGQAQVQLRVRPQAFRDLGDRYAPKFLQYGFNEGDIGAGLVKRSTQKVKDIQHPDTYGQRWGKEFLDTFGQSATSLLFTLRGGEVDWEKELQKELDMERDELRQQLRREFVNSWYGEISESDFVDDPEDLLDGDAEWDELPQWIQDDYDDYIEERVREITIDDVKWDDLRDEQLGISGMLMRGLDAETLVNGAEFFDIDDWLDETFPYTYYSDSDDTPSFEEWEAERFGPGQPAGPEEEARRRARYHKEVAADSDAPDPMDVLGTNEETQERIERQMDETAEEDLGDYDYFGVPHMVEDTFDSLTNQFGDNEHDHE